MELPVLHQGLLSWLELPEDQLVVQPSVAFDWPKEAAGKKAMKQVSSTYREPVPMAVAAVVVVAAAPEEEVASWEAEDPDQGAEHPETWREADCRQNQRRPEGVET